MPLSWNEIKKRSIEFSNEWKDESRENAEAKSFWDSFFNIFGIKRRRIASFEEPVNICAAELMGKLHDALKDNGFVRHPLEVFLVRIMFCLFAEDTGIFDKGIFTHFIEDISREDGIDLGNYISIIFQVLNTPECLRQKNLDEELNELPYIDGQLFEEPLPMPCFDSKTRKILLECCYYDWSRVSPAIFGSMFQSVMDRDKRSDIGAFYTSEKNILKTIKPLFLDDLIEAFHSHINNRKYLQNMVAKINNMKFLDPACGCGNFLIITYRELRQLQQNIFKTQLLKLPLFLQIQYPRVSRQEYYANIFSARI